MAQAVSRYFIGVSLLCGLLLMPARANADQINFNGPALTKLVTIGGSISTNYHGQVQAGALSWTWAGTPPAGFAQSFYSYCVDLAHFVTDPQYVTVRSSDGFTNGVTGGGSKAAWLFNQYAAGIHQITDLTTAALYSAGLQIAIWEAMYDSTANLAGGGFTATSSNATVMTAATGYLTELYKSNMVGVATILDSTRSSGQDQIVAQVGEPSTLLLMGLAFFGFATLARRRVVAS
jgi:hypothetical protein